MRRRWFSLVVVLGLLTACGVNVQAQFVKGLPADNFKDKSMLKPAPGARFR
jgi:hypothetical protein